MRERLHLVSTIFAINGESRWHLLFFKEHFCCFIFQAKLCIVELLGKCDVLIKLVSEHAQYGLRAQEHQGLLQFPEGHWQPSHFGSLATWGGSTPSLPTDCQPPTGAGKAGKQVWGGGKMGRGGQGRLWERWIWGQWHAPDSISFFSLPTPFSLQTCTSPQFAGTVPWRPMAGQEALSGFESSFASEASQSTHPWRQCTHLATFGAVAPADGWVGRIRL